MLPLCPICCTEPKLAPMAIIWAIVGNCGSSAGGSNLTSERGGIAGSIFKREKGTVLRHRSKSQRRAMPAAFYGEFRQKTGNSQTKQKYFYRCRFWSLGAGLRCRKSGICYSRNGFSRDKTGAYGVLEDT